METIKSWQKKPELPSTSTKKTEARYLRAIFEQARRWGYVSSQTIPIIKTERLKSRRRQISTSRNTAASPASHTIEH